MTAPERYRAALEKGDLDAMLATLAPAVVLRSPITAAYVFDGFDDVAELMAVLFEDVGITDVEVTALITDGPTAALFHRAAVGGVRIEEATLLRLDGEGLISEIVLHIRPLPALAALVARLGPPMSRRRGRGKATVARAMGAPLAVATRAGERVVPWLLKRAGQPGR